MVSSLSICHQVGQEFRFQQNLLFFNLKVRHVHLKSLVLFCSLVVWIKFSITNLCCFCFLTKLAPPNFLKETLPIIPALTSSIFKMIMVHTVPHNSLSVVNFRNELYDWMAFLTHPQLITTWMAVSGVVLSSPKAIASFSLWCWVKFPSLQCQSKLGINILFSHYVCDSFLSHSLCSDWKFKMCTKHPWMFIPPIYKLPIQT